MAATLTLILVCIVTLIIHAAETLSYSIRLAGIRAGKLAVALSLSGVIVLVSRTANLIQGPAVAKLIVYAQNHPEYALLPPFRMVLLSASAGTFLAILLFPTSVQMFSRIIAHLEVSGSIPRMLSGVTPQQLRNAKHHVRAPRLSLLRALRYMGIPKRLLLLNSLVTAIYTIGVLASCYAAFLNPATTAIATMSTGLINGLATILLTLFVDPHLGLMMDRAMHDETEKQRLGRVFGVLMASRWLGTLLAQVLFLPAAYWIGLMVKLING